jgi:phage-related protein
MKDVLFHPSVKNILRSFPREVRKGLGKAIFELQLGISFSYPLSRPMPAIGSGIEELRIKDGSGAYRVIYLAKCDDAILIVHAFQKKTPKTPLKEIQTAKKRLGEML